MSEEPKNESHPNNNIFHPTLTNDETTMLGKYSLSLSAQAFPFIPTFLPYYLLDVIFA